jgi:hypothetical protein
MAGPPYPKCFLGRPHNGWHLTALALVRVTHWVTMPGFIALLVSGIEILISHPRFYWGETGMY